MRIIKRNENGEVEYILIASKTKLETLLNELIRDTKYSVDGTFNASINNVVDFENNTFIAGEELPNGEPVYTNVTRIFRYSSGKPHGYVNDSLAVSGTKTYVPELASIIAGIINEDEASIQAFIDYPVNEELIPVKEKLNKAISQVNKKIGEIQNVSYAWKMAALDSLNNIFDRANKNQHFDAALLEQYYRRACDLITIIKSCDVEFESDDIITLARHTPYENQDRA